MTAVTQGSGQQLTVAQRAVKAFSFEEAELRTLAESSASIVKITNADGRQQVHAARMALKNQRIEIEKHGKKVRDEAVKFGKAVIEVENRLIAIIEPEETRLNELQKAYDDAEEAARQKKIEAELQRVEGIKARIADIRSVVEISTRYGAPTEVITANIEKVGSLVIDETFQEFRQEAADVRDATLGRLREAHIAAVAREEEQRKAAEAQAELERLRAEQRERDHREASERAARDAAVESERKRLFAIQVRLTDIRGAVEACVRWNASAEKIAAHIADIEAVAIDDSFAELRELAGDAKVATLSRLRELHAAALGREAEAAAVAAEQARIAEEQRLERERIEADSRRLDAQRAELERQQREAQQRADAEAAAKTAAEEAEQRRRQAAEELAKRTRFPGENAIVDALMEHFGVAESVIHSWLSQLRKAA